MATTTTPPPPPPTPHPHHPLLLPLFSNLLPLAAFFNNITSMIYGVDIKRNSRGELISSCFEDYKTMLHSSFTSNTCMAQQAEI